MSLIGESGSARRLGPWETSTTGRAAWGNHVTRTGALSLSHGRAAAASVNEPAGVFVGSRTVRPETDAAATETRSTGMSKRTCARRPRGTVTKRFGILASGV